MESWKRWRSFEIRRWDERRYGFSRHWTTQRQSGRNPYHLPCHIERPNSPSGSVFSDFSTFSADDFGRDEIGNFSFIDDLIDAPAFGEALYEFIEADEILMDKSLKDSVGTFLSRHKQWSYEEGGAHSKKCFGKKCHVRCIFRAHARARYKKKSTSFALEAEMGSNSCLDLLFVFLRDCYLFTVITIWVCVRA